MGSVIFNPYGKPDGTPRNNKTVPLYNGVRFTVDSEYKGRNGYRYIGEILDAQGAGTIGALKHNKDLNDGYGYFDFGRLLEAQINNERKQPSSYTTPVTSPILQDGKYTSSAMIFKEEFTRNLIIDTMVAVPVGFVYNHIFTFTEPHLLRAGDVVWITRNGSNVLNFTVFSVLSPTSVSFIGTKNFIESQNIQTTDNVVEAERFVDNYFYQGNVGFIIPSTRPSYFRVGDRIYIKQYGTPTNPEYNGNTRVKEITSVNVGGTSYTLVVTDKGFRENTPAEAGYIVGLDKYLIEGNIPNNQLTNTFNGVIPYEEYPTWDAEEFEASETAVGKFLTNAGRPNTTPLQQVNPGEPITRVIDVDRDDFYTLSMFRGSQLGSVNWDEIQYWFYRENFTLKASASVSLSFDVDATGIYDIGVGPGQFANQPSFDDTVKYVVVNLTRDPALYGDCTEKIMFRINEPTCSRYDKYRFKFMNQYGQWDYYNFTKRSDETISMDRSAYRRRLNRSNNGNFAYNVGDRGNTTYNVNAQRSVQVSTDWLDNFDKNYLEELFLSPMVYVIKDGQELPINITNSELQKGLEGNYGLFRYTINFDYAYKINTHRN